MFHAVWYILTAHYPLQKRGYLSEMNIFVFASTDRNESDMFACFSWGYYTNI